jgi:predicted nucleotidyltransferase
MKRKKGAAQIMCAPKEVVSAMCLECDIVEGACLMRLPCCGWLLSLRIILFGNLLTMFDRRIKMQPTAYPHVNAVLENLLAQMQAILGDKLVGLYLYGSLVAGDYDDDTSDIDLLAATSGDIDTVDFDALNTMQEDFVAARPKWQDRLEIAYLSLHALKTFKTEAHPIAIISPGEPFNIKNGGRDWLVNWYVVREKGVTLFGPPPETIIAPVSKEEFIEVVKEHLVWWRDWINEAHPRGAQAYAILTMCRALYTVTHGEQLTKPQAALWAQQEFPEWASTIRNALMWRKVSRDKNIEIDHAATLPETRRFVKFVIDRILG